MAYPTLGDSIDLDERDRTIQKFQFSEGDVLSEVFGVGSRWYHDKEFEVAPGRTLIDDGHPMFMVDRDQGHPRPLGFDGVGKFEYRVGDGKNDVDLLVRRVRIAFEVDAAVDRLVGWDDDCPQMRGGCRELGCFPRCSLFDCLEFADLEIGIWIRNRRGVVWGGLGWSWNVLELRGWNVEEDFGLGGGSFDAKVLRGEVDGDGCEVGNVDDGPGVAAFG